MRRNLIGLAVTVLLGGVAAAWFLHPGHEPAPKLIAKQGPGENPGPNLPLSQVVLFNSGVGYFQREGEVEGNARVDLHFPVGDINDLLKSMVLQDLGGGKVGAVSYDSQDPIEKTLRSFAVNLTGNPTFGQMLNQARGEKVEVVLQQTAAGQPGTLTGGIIGMEAQTEPVGKAACSRSRAAQSRLCRGHAQREAERRAARALPQPRLDGEVQARPGSAGRRARHAEEGGQPELQRRRQAQGARRLRRREPDLEDELPAGPR